MFGLLILGEGLVGDVVIVGVLGGCGGGGGDREGGGAVVEGYVAD